MNLFEYIEKLEAERDRFERMHGKAKTELAELKVIVRELLAADSRKDIFDRLRRAVEED